VVPEERDPSVREIIVEPYRVIYELNATTGTVDVLRVWHAARGRPEM
jgi:plasmid stabilization system protein ParE